MFFQVKCHSVHLLIIFLGVAACYDYDDYYDDEFFGISGSSGKGRGNHYYPIDTSDTAELNQIRCVDRKGHVSGKHRWPYACLLPAAHLATGRLYDGTSSLPERVTTPPWLNLTLFAEGQRFARENSGHLLMSHIYGLFCTNLFLDSKEVLLFSGGFDTPDEAARTSTRIANRIFEWYRNTPPATDYPTFNEVARSIRNVRRIHRNVSVTAEARIQEQRQTDLINPSLYKSRTVNEALWNAFKMDISMSPIPFENRRFPIEYELTEEKRLPLNQFIQAITQFGFVGIPVLFPERVGLTNATNEELYAFNHVWAVLGYCLGIRDEYNISLQPDLYTTRKYFQDIFETFIEPAFFQIDFFTKVLADAVLEGVNRLEVTMTPRILMTRILRDILRIPVPNMVRQLGSFDRISLAGTDPILRNNGEANRLLISSISERILSTAEFDILAAPAQANNNTKNNMMSFRNLTLTQLFQKIVS